MSDTYQAPGGWLVRASQDTIRVTQYSTFVGGIRSLPESGRYLVTQAHGYVESVSEAASLEVALRGLGVPFSDLVPA